MAKVSCNTETCVHNSNGACLVLRIARGKDYECAAFTWRPEPKKGGKQMLKELLLLIDEAFEKWMGMCQKRGDGK